MITVPQPIKALFENGGAPFRLSTKLQIIDRNSRAVIAEFDDRIIDGQVTLNRDRTSIRDCSFTVLNHDGLFTWGPDRLIWLDKLVKLYRGVWYNGSYYWISLGVYPCRQPSSISDLGNGTAQFQESDTMSAWGKSGDTIIIPAGHKIDADLKVILQQNGVESQFLFDDPNTTAPYDLNWSANTEYTKLAVDAAGIPTWRIFKDSDDILRLRAPIDPNSTPPMFSLDANKRDFNLYIGSTRTPDLTNFANHVRVLGGSAQTTLVSYEIMDIDPSSPTNVKRIGDFLYNHNNGNADPVITDNKKAKDRGDYEFRSRIQVLEKVPFRCYQVPFAEPEDVWYMYDTVNGVEGNYQLINLTIPLGIGQEMTGEAWKVRKIA